MGQHNKIEQWLRPKLKAKKMKVEDITKAAGISRATLYNYFNDARRPSPEVMAKICRALGVPVEDGMRQFEPKQTGRPPTR